MEYYGNKHKGGVRGHFYHVFDTVSVEPFFSPFSSLNAVVAYDPSLQPLYYNLPEGAEV